MRKLLVILTLLGGFSLCAQEHLCAIHKQRSASIKLQNQSQQKSSLLQQTAHEHKYDVKFVHLDVNVERTNKNISGNVKTVAQVSASALDTFMTILHTNHTIDSIRFNGAL